ncbi:hypothetical protein [Streptomyces sp. NPDC023588]
MLLRAAGILTPGLLYAALPRTAVPGAPAAEEEHAPAGALSN